MQECTTFLTLSLLLMSVYLEEVNAEDNDNNNNLYYDNDECQQISYKLSAKHDPDTGLFDYIEIILMSTLLIYAFLFQTIWLFPKAKQILEQYKSKGQPIQAEVRKFYAPRPLNRRKTIHEYSVLICWETAFDQVIIVNKEEYHRLLWKQHHNDNNKNDAPPVQAPSMTVYSIPGNPNSVWSGDTTIFDYSLIGKFFKLIAILLFAAASVWPFVDYITNFCFRILEFVSMVVLYVLTALFNYWIVWYCDYDSKLRGILGTNYHDYYYAHMTMTDNSIHRDFGNDNVNGDYIRQVL